MSDPKERLARIEAIFNEVMAVPAESRQALLQKLCDGDEALLVEVTGLLRAFESERSSSGARRREQLAEELAASHKRIGPYELESLLGRGGMGAVYLAHRADGQYEKKVAIKLIDLPLATDLFRARFRQERQILAGLDHPLIARLLDGGVSEEGSPYLVMDYVEGKPIDKFCQDASLTVAQRLVLFKSVCDAVQFAHQNLVVHRDVKPDNILVSADGVPHLLDFGTAKLLTPDAPDVGSRSTQEGFFSFTPQYASPEQILGKPITIATDVYSLGVLLFLLLTNELPYQLGSLATEELIEVICKQQPHRPSTAKAPAGKLDADLDSIVLKALRKDPEERYVTVEQLSGDVQAYLEDRPVAARRGNMRYLTVKFARRHRVVLSAAALLFITLICGIVGVLWQAHVANRERLRAEARTADLRQLSNSLLSELDEALKEIPGSTGAQKLLVTRVLEHLDHMAKDAKDDRQTALDLIGAYTRLGNVQSNTYYQNLGDTAGAVASFDKALALAGPLAEANPQDREVLRAQAATLEARGESLSDAGDPQASTSSLQAAVRTYDKVIQFPGVTPSLIFEAAIANETLGNELGEDAGQADAAAAIAAYRHALEMDNRALTIDPNYMAVRRGLPVMYMHIGNAELDTAPDKALLEFRSALKLQDALPQEQKKKLSQVRLHALLLRKEAEAYSELGKYSLAVPLFTQAVAIYRGLMDADSKNVTALGDMRRVLDDEAVCYERAADPVLAEVHADRQRNLTVEAQLLEEESGILRQLVASAPSHGPFSAQLANVLLRLGAVNHALGRPVGSPAETAASMTTLRHSAESAKAAPYDIDLAVSAALVIEPATLRDPSLVVALAERGVELSHHKVPSYLLLLARAYHAHDQPEKARAAAEEGLNLLPPALPEAGRSRLRRLLEEEAQAKNASLRTSR